MCKCIAIPTNAQYERGVRTRQFKSYTECDKAMGIRCDYGGVTVKELINNGGVYGGFFFDEALDGIDYNVEFKK